MTYTVTSIRDWTFGSCTSLTSISIPDGVTSIGDYAFRECTSLASISIPDGVTSIGYQAFYGCTSLMSISIPDGVTSIEGLVFTDCISLTSISIPDGVTSIGFGAFYGCTALANVNTSWATSDAIPVINDAIFESTNAITLTVATLSDGNDTQTAYTDKGWTSANHIQTITVVNPQNFTVDNINYTITDAANLEVAVATGSCAAVQENGSLTIPENVTHNGMTYTVTSIGEEAFYSCTSLTSISIPDAVTSIGVGTFRSCTSLTSISIPEGLTSIENSTFFNCTSLTSISIPDGVTSIGFNAFAACTLLTSISIPDGLTSIGQYAFAGCTSLMSISIPDGVISIGEATFGSCTSLTSISIPDGVTLIGGLAFYGCTSLTSISIPDGVTSIGYQAFFDCTALANVNTSWATSGAIPAINSTVFQNTNAITLTVAPLSDGNDTEMAYTDKGWTPANYIQTIIVDASLSISSQAIAEVHVYPNPVADQLHVRLADVSTLQSLNMYNSLGQLVATSKSATIAVDKLVTGHYILEVVTDFGRSTKQIIVQ